MVNAGSLTYVSIGGVDVTSYVINWRAPENISTGLVEATIFLSKAVDAVVTLSNRQAVVNKRGKTTGSENIVFSGFLEMKAPRGAIYEVLAANTLDQLDKIQVNNTYDKNNDPQAGVLSAIAEDLIETYGGLTADVTDSSSYSSAVDVFICNRDRILERLDCLREVLDWVLRWDPDNSRVVFEPKGNTVHPSVLRYNDQGTTNIRRTPKWESDSVDLVNSVEVIGKKLTDTQTESFDGDASNTVFTLANVPEQVKVTVGGTAQVLGIEGVSASYDFTVKTHLRQIVFQAASTPGSGSGNVVVEYGIALPPAFQIDDPNSIELYSPTDPSTGEKIPLNKTWFFDDVTTVPDAEQRAEELINHYSNPLLSTVLEIDHLETVLRAGQKIRVIDSINDVDEYFVVIEVLHQWPEPVDIIHIGQERVFQKNTFGAVIDRLRKLEKREGGNVSLVRKRRDLVGNIRFYPCLLTYRRNTEFDGAWGKGFGDGTSKNDYTWGEAGGLWQSTYTNEPALYAVNWADNTSEEDFTDDTLIDTVNSNASINTTTMTIIF